MATVTVTRPNGTIDTYQFDTWAVASIFADDYYTGLSYADGIETIVEVSA